MIPGEMKIEAGEIELNAGSRTLTVEVANTGDRQYRINTVSIACCGKMDGWLMVKVTGTTMFSPPT